MSRNPLLKVCPDIWYEKIGFKLTKCISSTIRYEIIRCRSINQLTSKSSSSSPNGLIKASATYAHAYKAVFHNHLCQTEPLSHGGPQTFFSEEAKCTGGGKTTYLPKNTKRCFFQKTLKTLVGPPQWDFLTKFVKFDDFRRKKIIFFLKW